MTKLAHLFCRPLWGDRSRPSLLVLSPVGWPAPQPDASCSPWSACQALWLWVQTHTHTIVSSVQTLFNLKVWQRLNIWYLPVNVLETLCSTCLAIMFLFENYIYLKQTHFDLSSTGCQENPSSSLIPPVSSKTLFNIFTYFDTIYNTSLYVIISTEIFC